MRLLTLLLTTLLCTCVRAQTSEFQIHDNGFIYPEATMSDLAYIVDSLDLKFKQCDLDRRYLAPAQTMANCYTVDNDNWKKVRDRLTKATAKGPINVKTLYPGAELTRRGILYINNGSPRNPGRQFNLLPLNFGYSLSFQPEGENVGRVTDLVYVSEGYEDTQIWVLDSDPIVREIPETYARMIQYVDCMVDTSGNIYREKSTSETDGYLSERNEINAATAIFERLAEKYPEKRPRFPKNRNESTTMERIQQYKKDMSGYHERRLEWLQGMIDQKAEYNFAYEDLVRAVEKGESVSELAEELLEQLHSPALALESKRLRRVYGSCSQDDSPRIHAMQIARLSAAAVEWPIFLRAHLNIMNDRFDRVSDGSYAYAGRGTYLAEVEALGIDAVGLLIGSCLEAEDMSTNHYQGSWSRVGRALTEAEDSDAVIAMLSDIIRNPKLDDLNRMTGVYLLRFMARNHGKEETDKRYTQALATAVAGLEAEWARLVEVE